MKIPVSPPHVLSFRSISCGDFPKRIGHFWAFNDGTTIVYTLLSIEFRFLLDRPEVTITELDLAAVQGVSVFRVWLRGFAVRSRRREEIGVREA